MNFISRTTQASSRSTEIKRKRGLWLLVVLLITIGLGMATVVFVSNPVAHHIRLFTDEIEQAKTVLEGEISITNMNEAQQHLARAQDELDALRPFVFPLLKVNQWVEKLPVDSTRLQQASALWDFSNSALNLADETLSIAIDGKTEFDSNGVVGLFSQVPQFTPKIEHLGQVYITAQAMRQTLGDVNWLPTKQAKLLQATLAQWDKYTPYYALLFAEGSPVIGQMLTTGTWEHISTLMQATTDFSSIVDVENADYAWVMQLPKQLNIIRTEFQAIQTQIDPVVAYMQSSKTAQSLDIPVEQIIAWEDFLDATTSGGQELSDALTLVITNMKETGASGVVSSIPELYRHTQQARDDFERATVLRRALHPVENMPVDISSLNKTLVLWDEVSPKLTQLFNTSDDVFKVIPQLVGNDHPVSFLLLIQSSDELRATGGFIGGIGTIRIEQGKIIETNLREVTELDNVPEVNGQYLTRWTQPPAPLVNYMGLGHWYLRDANWWADFPSTARQVADFWAINHDTPIDGVIAITENGVVNLLQALGTLQTLDGTEIDAENLKNIAGERIYQSDQNPGVEQSLLINEMSLALVNGTKDMSLGRTIRLAHFFQDATARHDILIASFDPPTAAGLFNLGLYGALGGQHDDYFYLVEANVSYNKLSPFIEQDLRYEVKLDSEGAPLEASLIVDEMNTYTPGKGLNSYPEGYYDGGRWNPEIRKVEQRPTYYGGYTRLYSPPTSNLIAAIGFDEGPDLFQEGHRTVVGGYVGITSGESRQLQFKWEPNAQPTHPGEYHLLVQRQPGAPEHALTVIVRMPKGFKAQDISPVPISVTDDVITWHTILDRDRIFDLKLEATSDTTTVPIPKAPIVKPEGSTSITSTETTTTTYQVAPAPPAPPGRTPLPIWINIPAIQVNAPIVAVGLEASGIMASPDDAGIVGWYELGPRPGEASNAILAGHVDWKGEVGVFSRLGELKIGDMVEIRSAPDVAFEFIVESLELYSTQDAPLEEIFGATPKSALTLITCGGPYDSIRQEYQDRLVIRARRK